jgi:hypothetical protein
MNIPDYNPHNPIEDPPDELDAYGHLTWTVGTLEDQSEGGEWMACFDAIYDENTNSIRYEVVVDGGTFVDTPDRGSISPDKIEDLKSLPDYWHEVGLEASAGLLMDEDLLAETKKNWAAHIDDLYKQARDPEEVEAIVEQSPDYFNRYIAGDK